MMEKIDIAIVIVGAEFFAMCLFIVYMIISSKIKNLEYDVKYLKKDAEKLQKTVFDLEMESIRKR